MAKDDTSIPKIPSNGLPINKNASSIKKETIVTLPDLTFPDLAFMLIIIGIDPGISIIANNTIKAARTSIKLKCIYSKIKLFYWTIVISSTRCFAPA